MFLGKRQNNFSSAVEKKVGLRKTARYSKSLAFIFFVILVLLAFYFGYKYGELKTQEKYIPILFNYNFGKVSLMDNKEKENSEEKWVVFVEDNYGFSFKYPKELEQMNPVGNWRYFSSPNSPGIQLVKLKIPAIYEMNTNFVEAFFSVGVSSSTLDIQNCFLPSAQEKSLGTVEIGKVIFYKFAGNNLEAGHQFEVESYKTLHHNVCYNLELVIHSIDTSVFPQFSSYSFNKERVYNLLEKVKNSFIFTK